MVGVWMVKPGKEEEFVQQGQEFAQWTLNSAKGARWVYLVRDQQLPNSFIFFSAWDSPETITAWQNSSKSKTALAGLQDLCEDVYHSTMREVVYIKK